MIGKHSLFGTDIKYVLALTLLALITYSLPEVKAAIHGAYSDTSYSYAQAIGGGNSTWISSSTSGGGSSYSSSSVKEILPYLKKEPVVRCNPFSRNLGVGDRGEKVRELSKYIYGQKGYSGRVTEVYDEDMAIVMVAFQQQHGIKASGYFGHATRMKVNDMYNKEHKCKAPGVNFLKSTR